MFRVLLRKEWRQLRTLRWAGIVLGLAMPAIAAAGAEMGRRGWIPLATGRDWTVAEIFAELAPALVCLFVWPLMALLLTAQALTADFAGGTESFLLQRPVSRGRVWFARVAAATASACTLAAWTGAAMLSVAFLSVGPDGLNPELIRGLVLAGTGGIGLAVVSALPSAALIRSPVGTVLGGLLFAAVPAVCSAFLGSAFPFATLGGSPYPLGVFAPWLLLIGYALASRSAETRGEPAGRRRRLRAARSLTITAAAVAVVFLGGAALAVRLAPAGTEVVPCPRDGVAAVIGGWWGSGELVDSSTGKTIRRVPPPAYSAAWNDYGTILAVATAGSTLGALDRAWRVEVFDRAGELLSRPIRGSESAFPLDLTWSGDRLLALVGGPGEGGHTVLYGCTPGRGPFRQLSLETDVDLLRIISADVDGFRLLARERPTSGNSEPLSTRIVEFRWNGPEVETVIERTVPYPAFLSPFSEPLSPSGRYLVLHVIDHVDDRAPEHVEPERIRRVRPILVDLESGDWKELTGRPGHVAWTQGDRLAWAVRGATETAVYTGTPEGEARFERAWTEAHVSIASSPDRSRLLVTVRPRRQEDPLPSFAAESFGPIPWQEGDAPKVKSTELWLFEPRGPGWTGLSGEPLLESPSNGVRAFGWANPSTVYRTDAEGPDFLSLDRLR